MRSVALLLALCAAAAAARESVEDEWRRFKTEHGRRFASAAFGDATISVPLVKLVSVATMVECEHVAISG